DRDVVMFQAGRSSVARPTKFWPCTTLILIVVAGLQSWLLWHRLPRETMPVGRVLQQSGLSSRSSELPAARTSSAPPRSAPPALPYTTAADDAESQARIEDLKLSREVVRWGVEALPALRPMTVPPGKPAPMEPLPRLPRQTNPEPNAWLSCFFMATVP